MKTCLAIQVLELLINIQQLFHERALAIIISYPTSASGIIVLLKKHQQMLLDFADFAWLEQPEGNLMDPISRVWYNGSYTIAAKPIIQ